jgi:hypothetical protein
MRRRLVLAVVIGIVAAGSTVSAALASAAASVAIETSKPPGPAAGTFAATGAFVESGSIVNVAFVPSALGAPTFGVSHIKVRFTGANGTFTISAQIVEALTADPNVLTDTGTWTVIDGTGAYANLRGGGTVTGTVDDNISLISRTYTGDVHFD